MTMAISLTLFPQGRSRALTMSYDDGVVEDRRLVEIFNRHGHSRDVPPQLRHPGHAKPLVNLRGGRPVRRP